jgi:antibiotic biosynthesis monooxygenase (ABM) superfamily enzyme
LFTESALRHTQNLRVKQMQSATFLLLICHAIRPNGKLSCLAVLPAVPLIKAGQMGDLPTDIITHAKGISGDQPFDAEFRFTDTKDHGRWRLWAGRSRPNE